jgi:lipopolysaccharide export system permease protein
VLKTVDRLILRELWGPFLFGVGLFSMLVISTVVLQEALKFVSTYEQPASIFFRLVLYSMPQFIVLSIPMGVLLGTLLSVGRLNTENEIIALRACGISLYRVLAPYFVVGILLSCVTFLGSEIIVPYCNSQAVDLEKAVISGKYGLGTRQRFHWPFYNHDTGQLEWVLVAGEVEDSTLRDVVLIYFDAKDNYRNFMVEADRAEWRGSTWVFFKMRQVKLQRSESGDEQLIAEADRAIIPDFSIRPDVLKRRQKSSEDLNILQLSTVIRNKIKDEGLQASDREILDYRTALQFKVSIPLTPLFFIIVAVPMAIMPQRSSRAMGMGLALLTVLAYYSLFVVFQKVGVAGYLPPVVAAWIPNSILFFTGVVLLQLREQN